MRILHCIPRIAGGGAERQLGYLAQELSRLGQDVHVVALSGGPDSERLQASGARLHWLRARGNYDPWIFGQLVGTMRALRPDLVQVWLVQMEVLAGLAATVLRLPWIFSERASAMAYPPGVKHWLRVRVARTAAGIVSNSAAGDAYWRTRVDGRVTRYVIPNALPVAEIDATSPADPEEMGLEAGQRVVLCVGRFSGQKNLGVLVTALRRVLDEPKTIAVLCGEGPLRADLERQLIEGGIRDRVRLPGYVKDIWGWMKRADVFVAPSLFEGQPNAVLEAMACGCPLVVSDIPAHRELLDPTTAVLVNPHDAGALARVLLGTLAEPAAARERARTARVRVTPFSAPAVAARYREVYESVLATRRRPAMSRVGRP
jgi:glycosyltransferase involved in cell wall biosynthesis